MTMQEWISEIDSVRERLGRMKCSLADAADVRDPMVGNTLRGVKWQLSLLIDKHEDVEVTS